MAGDLEQNFLPQSCGSTKFHIYKMAEEVHSRFRFGSDIECQSGFLPLARGTRYRP